MTVLAWAAIAVAAIATLVIVLLVDLRVYVNDPTLDKYHHERFNRRYTAWALLVCGVVFIACVGGFIFQVIYDTIT